MNEFRIDKTIVKAQRLEDAAKDVLFSKDVSLAERLRMSFHLSCVIHGIEAGDSLKIDTSIFSARKFQHE